MRLRVLNILVSVHYQDSFPLSSNRGASDYAYTLFHPTRRSGATSFSGRRGQPVAFGSRECGYHRGSGTS